MSSKVSIFGREPAFYVSLVSGALALALSFNFLGLTQNQSAVIIAAVTAVLGFYVAFVTRESLLAVGTGMANSLAALFIAFGLHLTQNQTAAATALFIFVLGSFHRTQATPVLPGDPARGLSNLASD